MSSSRNVIRTPGQYGSFLDRLKSSHEVQESLPAYQNAREQIQVRYEEAYQTGLASGKSEGTRQGYDEGYKAGLVKAEAEIREQHEAALKSELESFTHDLSDFKSTAEQQMDAWYKEAEERLALLAIEIARRALGQDLALSQESVFETAKAVLQESIEGTEFRIRVNVAHAPLLDARKQDLIDAVPHARNIEVVSDPHIQGGCIVETGASSVDARIETYLDRLAESIRGEAA